MVVLLEQKTEDYREHWDSRSTHFLCSKKEFSGGEKAADTVRKDSSAGEKVSNQVPNVPNVPIGENSIIESAEVHNAATDVLLDDGDAPIADIFDPAAEQRSDMDAARMRFESALGSAQDNPRLLATHAFIADLKLLFGDNEMRLHCRAMLKRCLPKGVRLSDVLALIEGDYNEGCTTAPDSVASDLIGLVTERGELFFDSEADKGYAEINGAVYQIGSKSFVEWLGFQYFNDTKLIRGQGAAASESAIKQACNTLSGIAKHDGQKTHVYLRSADYHDGHYLFIGDDGNRVIEITATGWRVVQQSPVKFWKPAAMMPLPEPTIGGSIDALWRFVNVEVEDRPLVLAWLLECWRSETPFPILMLSGLQGSAKSSSQKRLRELIDNNSANLKSAPKTVEDIFVGANTNWLASFENISHLTPNMQDALCTLATGGGYATRKLYTNDEESVINVKRPVVINGIPNSISAQDLIDRAICLELPKIDYKEETEIGTEWDKAKGSIMGGLLDLFVATLAQLPNVKLHKPPRMADFTKLGEAMMLAMGEPAGSFTAIYQDNRAGSIAHALESSPVGVAVREMAEVHHPLAGATVPVFHGTVKRLYDLLTENYKGGEGWPRSPKGMSEAIKRQSPALLALGIEVINGKRKERIDGQQGLTIKIVKHGV